MIVRQALRACKRSECEFMLAAVLYKGGSIIRVCTNQNKTIRYRTKYFYHGEPSRHAEINAIHNIPPDVIQKCSLLVVRINKQGEVVSAKPCMACANILKDSGIKKVHYSSYNGEILKLNFNEISLGTYQKELCSLKD